MLVGHGLVHGPNPSFARAPGSTPECGSVESVPSTLRVTYDGNRRGGRDYVVIEPGSIWGEKAYGLAPGDDYTFQPRGPEKGDRLSVVVSDDVFRLLVLQRERRKQEASPTRRKVRPPWRQR